jgi:hypothetical protein
MKSTKHEYRSTKQIRMSEILMFETLRFRKLRFISDLGFRISSLRAKEVLCGS